MNLTLPAVFNPYERKARLYPALLAIFPVVGTAILSFHDVLSLLQSLAAVLVGAGGAFLCAELGRDGGKKIEPGLMESWGGPPSMTIFRHSDPRLDAVNKARYRSKLAEMVQTPDPTPQEEAADPAAADATYLAWSNYIRTHTRDTKTYALLFQENVSYGFRRNALGLRTFALILSGLCVIAPVALMVVRQKNDFANVSAIIVDLLFLVFWSFVVREEWIKIPALGYSQQLAEAVDTLGAVKPLPKKAAPKRKTGEA